MSRVYRMLNAPTADEYVRGLEAIRNRVTDEHIRFFRVHYHAPDRTATSKQIGEWGTPPRSHGVVNSLYGKLAHTLCDALGILPELRPNDKYRWWSVWSCGWNTPRGFVWQLLPQVAEALEQLGWIEPVPIRLPEEISSPRQYVEGALTQRWVNAYERNTQARDDCKKIYGTACVICGFDFGKVFGSEFAGFIHVHHLKPLGEIKKEYEVDPVADLIPVCPNCHAAIHHGGETRTPEKVKALRTTNGGA